MKYTLLLAGLLIVPALAGCFSSQDGTRPISQASADGQDALSEPRVVVATFDTGTNPFHPCWRREGLDFSATFPELVGVAKPLELVFADDYETSLRESRPVLDALEPYTLYHIVDTNLLFYGASEAPHELVDEPMDPAIIYGYHGAYASSLIACRDYGFSPDSWVVIVDWYKPQGITEGIAVETEDAFHLIAWVSTQAWIDVVHFNIQRMTPYPVPTGYREGIQSIVDSGKSVVFSAGNGWGNALGHIPTETVDYFAIEGVHLVGAIQDRGWYWYSSNLDPHIVMDGCGVIAADASSFGNKTVSGTSFSSPLAAGYHAEVLRRVRNATGSEPATADALLVSNVAPRPGPLADGALDVSEFHEVVRKTADPSLPPSRFDGPADHICGEVTPPVDMQGHDYHRIGYGKTTEDTLEHAVAVILGAEPMPERPTADMYYEASTTVRDAYWGVVDP